MFRCIVYQTNSFYNYYYLTEGLLLSASRSLRYNREAALQVLPNLS